MNNPFCKNKLCRCHVECPPGANRVMILPEPSVETAENVEIRRIRVNCDGIEFDFCEVCANVLAMIHGVKPKTENQKPNEIQEEMRRTNRADGADGADIVGG